VSKWLKDAVTQPLSRIMTIAGRELRSLFLSPIAYVVIAAYLAMVGLFWWLNTGHTGTQLQPNEVFRGFAYNMHVFMLFIVPAMSMRALADERRSRTLELLVTQPVRDWEIVLGKWLACLGLLVVVQVCTLHFYVQLNFWSEGAFEDPRAWNIYLGILLSGMLYMAIGVFFSAITENQVVAALLTFGVLIAVFFMRYIGESQTGFWQGFLTNASSWGHFEDFARGILDTKHVVYYVLSSVGFLFMAVRSLESRSWG
jgi:ABC-2 type transport system permease protein